MPQPLFELELCVSDKVTLMLSELKLLSIKLSTVVELLSELGFAELSELLTPVELAIFVELLTVMELDKLLPVDDELRVLELKLLKLLTASVLDKFSPDDELISVLELDKLS